jgi:hypothetical protein
MVIGNSLLGMRTRIGSSGHGNVLLALQAMVFGGFIIVGNGDSVTYELRLLDGGVEATPRCPERENDGRFCDAGLDGSTHHCASWGRQRRTSFRCF